MTFRSENIIGFVFWWCFTSYHGIHHHLSPPFGRKNWNFFQASSRRKFPSSEILLLTLTDLTVYGTGILYVPKIYHQNQRKKTLANISKAGLVVGEWSIFPGFSPNLQTNLTKPPETSTGRQVEAIHQALWGRTFLGMNRKRRPNGTVQSGPFWFQWYGWWTNPCTTWDV